ncbi:ankyrin repeat domain-containing protein [Vandammella animalimorsus]|uniref:Ankyrin repeat domain-containing protein n=1 Tax=Vandammella animalimorsus TaxID=2029117 RepID=A0A3M6R4W0_9BURK|nr:ankyrin repeat domain-containing protein [Vandammella animalimorsus]RMX10361.1 ankyrin repeat domain-containing protein [Vandammella animalimorsus]
MKQALQTPGLQRRTLAQALAGVAATLALGLLAAPEATWAQQPQQPGAKAAQAARQNEPGVERLFTAVKRDNGSAMQRLLAEGANPNVRDAASGQTPMTLALQLESLNVFNALMASRSTNVEYRNARDESPLMMAAIRGNLDAVTRLVRQGAHVNKPQWTPLHYAASGTSEEHQLAITELLLAQHAYIDAQSPNGTTPLMMAAQYGTDAVARLLMQEGADPLMKNQLGMTAVDFARRVGRETLAKEIIRYSQQVQQRRSQPRPTPAQPAAR